MQLCICSQAAYREKGLFSGLQSNQFDRMGGKNPEELSDTRLICPGNKNFTRFPGNNQSLLEALRTMGSRSASFFFFFVRFSALLYAFASVFMPCLSSFIFR
jgi:hypothetical protein